MAPSPGGTPHGFLSRLSIRNKLLLVMLSISLGATWLRGRVAGPAGSLNPTEEW